MPVIKGLEFKKVIINGLECWEPVEKKQRNRLPKPKDNLKLSDYSKKKLKNYPSEVSQYCLGFAL